MSVNCLKDGFCKKNVFEHMSFNIFVLVCFKE